MRICLSRWRLWVAGTSPAMTFMKKGPARDAYAVQSPLLPPVLLTRRTVSMTIPFSAALSMS